MELFENADFSGTDRDVVVNFGDAICDDYAAGLTFEDVLDKYQPTTGEPLPFGEQGSDTRNAWLEQTSGGITQILFVSSVALAADLDLCPGVKPDDGGSQ